MDISEKIKNHALREYPYECVGYVSGNEYIKLKNVAHNKKETFRLSAVDNFKLQTLNKNNGSIILVHSHPIMENRPSEADKLSQKMTKFNYMIIGTDGKNTTDIRSIRYEKGNS